MKVLSLIISSAGSLLLLYTTICGLWIHSHGATPAEISYHARYAAISVLLVVVGLGLLIIQSLKG